MSRIPQGTIASKDKWHLIHLNFWNTISLNALQHRCVQAYTQISLDTFKYKYANLLQSRNKDIRTKHLSSKIVAIKFPSATVRFFAEQMFLLLVKSLCVRRNGLAVALSGDLMVPKIQTNVFPHWSPGHENSLYYSPLTVAYCFPIARVVLKYKTNTNTSFLHGLNTITISKYLSPTWFVS